MKFELKKGNQVLSTQTTDKDGKVSFGKDKLSENFDTLLEAVVKAKPAAAKGTYIRSCSVASTMGVGIAVSTSKYGV